MEQEQYTPQIDEFINEEEEGIRQQLAEEFEKTDEPGKLVDDAEFDEDSEDEAEERENPFNGLIKIYEEGVARGDKRGFAEIYKTATEQFIRNVNLRLYEIEHGFQHDKTLIPEDPGLFHVKDLEYADGYFIFGFGTNSCISFHCEEAPGWLFGIWWSPLKANDWTEENESYRKDAIRCEFFVQYEKEIDKFKPTASTYVYDFEYQLGDFAANWWSFVKVTEIIKWLIKEPMLAWYREIHYTDYNVEHVTREEAAEAFRKNQEWHETKERLTKENNQKMIDTVKYIFKPFFDEGKAFIQDMGENCSPRYELIVHNYWKDEKGDESSEDGCFGMFNFGEWPDAEEDEKLYDKAEEECRQIAKDNNFYWFRAFNKVIVILSEPKFSKLKSEVSNQE